MFQEVNRRSLSFSVSMMQVVGYQGNGPLYSGYKALQALNYHKGRSRSDPRFFQIF